MGVLEDIKQQYPTLAFLVNDPEVGPLLRDAVDPNKGFSPTTFQAKFYETNWFKTRSATQRETEILMRTDPAEWQNRLQQTMAEVRAYASQLGIRLSDAEVRYMATNNLRNGLATNSPVFLDQLRTFTNAQKDSKFASGSILAATQQVEQIAKRQYYIGITDADAKRWGIELALGLKDEDALRTLLNQKAQSYYPHLKDLLKNGASMEDIFSGHRAVIAQELELSPEQVDFTKQSWRKVLHQIDPQTNKPRPMTLHEAQTLAREDRRWWSTANGREQDAGMANFMLQTFGKRA